MLADPSFGAVAVAGADLFPGTGVVGKAFGQFKAGVARV